MCHLNVDVMYPKHPSLNLRDSKWRNFKEGKEKGQTVNTENVNGIMFHPYIIWYQESFAQGVCRYINSSPEINPYFSVGVLDSEWF